MSSKNARKPAEPIAIVGMGCRFAGAENLQDYWRQALEGENGFSEVPSDRWDHDAVYSSNRRDADKTYAPRGGFIDDIRSFPAIALQIPPRRVEVMDPQQRISIEVALEALEDAGSAPAAMPDATGVFIGVTALEYRTLLLSRIVAQLMGAGQLGDPGDDAERFAAAVENVVAPRPYTAPGVLSNMVACSVAQELHLRGPAYSVDAACSSALIAVYDAVNQLRAGSIDAALAGGTYLSITPEHHIAFSRIGAMSEAGECLPFDRKADGFVQGDGCGLVVLKRYSDAVRDGDRIYSVLRGIAANNDGGDAGPMAPVKESQSRVINAAWQDSDVDPARLGYFETHGTGTLAGDKAEFDGIMDSIGANVKSAVLGSSKANVGHTMSAAGIAGLIRASLAIHHGKTPPMAGFDAAKDDLGIEDTGFRIPKSTDDWEIKERVACVSAFGFGGTNAHVVLEGERETKETIEQPELIQLSSYDEESLRTMAARTAAAMRQDPNITHAGVARTWARRRKQAHRLAIVAESRDELLETLEATANGENPRNATIGEAKEEPKIAFLYPGQGAQRIGMLSGIRSRFPVVAERLDELEKQLEGSLDRPLSHYLYPELRDEEISKEDALDELTATEVAQPALFSVAASLTALLSSVGVQPDITTGHSVGEFAAAVASGLMTAEEGAKFVAARGHAMAQMTGDKGGMIALKTTPEEAEKLLVPGAIVANINHPKQVVISGPTDAIDEVEKKAEEAKVRGIRLQVSHGFHSKVFDDLDLSQAIDDIQFSKAHTPIASCIDARTYHDPDTARDIFNRHAKSPVDFVQALKTCADEGADIYLQVAAGGPIATMAKRTLTDQMRDVITLASNKDDDGGASLLKGLGELWVRGVDIDSDAFTQEACLESLPPSVLPKEPYWGIKDSAQRRAHIKLAEKRDDKAALSVEEKEDAAPAKESVGSEGSDVRAAVVRAVAKASAYPADSLKDGMRLVEDLGFDSMMTADLIEDLGRNIEGLGSIPRDFFTSSPTLGDLVEYCENPTAETVDESADAEPLTRYRPVWRNSPLNDELPQRNVHGLDVLITGDAKELASSIGRALQQLRADVTICEPTDALDVDAPDIVIYCADDERAAPGSKLIENGDDILNSPERLIRLAAAQAEKQPEFYVLTRSDNPWQEGHRAVARSLTHEWPDTRVQTIGFDADSTPAERTKRFCQELQAPEFTVDVDWKGAERRTRGFDALKPLDSWTPDDHDKTLITGGTSGIGLKLGQAIAGRGGKVALLSRSEPSGETADWISESENVEWVQGDVTDFAGLKDAVDTAGPFTALVHCAGVLADGPLGSVSSEQGYLARAVKVRGWLASLAACGDTLERAVAVGSWAGRFGNRHQADYAAANAMLAASVDIINNDVRTSVVEFGPWTNTDMASTIPDAVKATMRNEGTDFVDDEPGIDALLESLGGEEGVCVRGRRVPETRISRRYTESLSTETHPFLSDHAIDGTPVVPFAFVLDRFHGLAYDGDSIYLSEIVADRPIQVTEALDVEWVRDGDQLSVRDAGSNTVYFRAHIDDSIRNDTPETYEDGGAAELTLDEFYEITFHGPLLRGIDDIRNVGDDGISGTIHGTTVSDWIPSAASDSKWMSDPLALDSAMQLAAVASIQRLGKIGLPLRFAESTVLRPFSADQTLRADVRFEQEDDSRAKLEVAIRDDDGPVYFARGIDVELIDASGQRSHEQPEADEPDFDVDPKYTDVAQWPEYQEIKLRTDMVEQAGLTNPYFDLHEGTARDTSIIEGRETINFSSYNYLGYSGDERVIRDVEEAVRKYGTSVSASRVASGERPFHRNLEAALAKANDVDDAIVFSGGHATNVNVIGHLFGPKDLIMHDELIHDSCLQGIKLSGAARRAFDHDTPEDLESQLRELRGHYEKVLVLIEGVYSMDGDIADVPEYIRIKKKYGCLLMIDEAHSFGTIGPRGLGVRDHFGFDGSEVDIWMGTMSKSLAAMGGWVAGREELIMYLRYTTPGFVFAAGIPPTLGQAALSSLNLMLEEPERVEKLQSNSDFFFKELKKRGLNTGPAAGESPVVPVITGDSMQALQLSEILLEKGVNAKPIIYPAVPEDAARLRFFLSSTHSEEQLLRTAELIEETLNDIRNA